MGGGASALVAVARLGQIDGAAVAGAAAAGERSGQGTVQGSCSAQYCGSALHCSRTSNVAPRKPKGAGARGRGRASLRIMRNQARLGKHSLSLATMILRPARRGPLPRRDHRSQQGLRWCRTSGWSGFVFLRQAPGLRPTESTSSQLLLACGVAPASLFRAGPSRFRISGVACWYGLLAPACFPVPIGESLCLCAGPLQRH